MPTNLLLMKENPEALELSRRLGFTKTLFLDQGFVLIEEKSPKELLKKIKEAQKKNLLIAVKPQSEDLLRLALEKTPAQLVFGQELLNYSDSLSFPRGGLDQILCKIAQEKNKILAFSFKEILEAKDRPKILRRIIFNLQLCRKYKLKIFFSNFSEELYQMRSAKDLQNFLAVLGHNQNSLEI